MNLSSKQNRQKKKSQEQKSSPLEEQIQCWLMQICSEQNKSHAQIIHKIQFLYLVWANTYLKDQCELLGK